VVCFAVAVLGALGDEPRELAAGALLTAPAPLTLGLAALVSVFITLIQGKELHSGPRGWAHWLGIVVCLLPLVFCAVWWIDNRVDPWPRNPIMRIRE
jgi:hypothetical protein